MSDMAILIICITVIVVSPCALVGLVVFIGWRLNR